eukprot:TRINITY_DN13167_c0_g1_i4.p1 TRINITY_DN13167_c0_g1~~TRINITY_DN13167_c0_g1_i4.p1  ORF type:complete len:516 (+),score=86.28 TRINITY_DN13167_c0_g1_i4:134-1681(+)
MMGGLSLTLKAIPGTQFQVTLSEELVGDPRTSRELLYPMRTGNKYRSVWTAGAGVSVFEHHEYMVFRDVEVKLYDGYNSTATCSEVSETEAPRGAHPHPHPHPETSPPSLSVHCPNGPGPSATITKVVFSSYGTPAGSCLVPGPGDDFKIDPNCHANSSQKVVEAACLGKSECTLEVSNRMFGEDPCHLTTKRLAVDVECSPAHPAPSLVTLVSLSAWVVKYPYFEQDSAFDTSNPMLNKVWALCENTLRVTSLDTATDSNTRERLPYEADGIITGNSRLALQREYTWPRHSWTHNLWNPTWPTEWRQTATLLGHTDYKHTGSLELFETFGQVMEDQSQIKCVNSTTKLVDFSKCARQTGGLGAGSEAQLRDIVDWPSNSRDGYVLGPTNTVVNAYFIHNVRQLSQLFSISGDHAKAAELSAQANQSETALNMLAVDPSSTLYADGVDVHGRPVNHTAWHASVFPAAFGLLPPSRWEAALRFSNLNAWPGLCTVRTTFCRHCTLSIQITGSWDWR